MVEKKPPTPPKLVPVSSKLNKILNLLEDEIIQDRGISKEDNKFKILSINVTWNPGCVLVERNNHWYWLCSY